MSMVFLIVARMLLFLPRVASLWTCHADDMVQKHAHPKEWFVDLFIRFSLSQENSIF